MFEMVPLFVSNVEVLCVDMSRVMWIRGSPLETLELNFCIVTIDYHADFE